MGDETKIAWTDSTSNCWHGCTKVDALCAHCYAEVSTPVRVKRANGLEVWGAKALRSETKGWEADLRRWNREALAAGKVRRVFAQSLSDTFEDRTDACVVRPDGRRCTMDDLRARYLSVIGSFEPLIGESALVFQLLTKRPENVLRMVPKAWLTRWPAHVWIGTSVGDQESAEKRIPHLLRIPAPVRFLSVEPQLGPVDVSWWLSERTAVGHGSVRQLPRVAWVICGGESGPKARPFDLAWARSLREQCRAAGVAFFLKQLGALPAPSIMQEPGVWLPLRDSHGGDESEWPADLRGCRAFPVTTEPRTAARGEAT